MTTKQATVFWSCAFAYFGGMFWHDTGSLWTGIRYGGMFVGLLFLALCAVIAFERTGETQ